jgi:hypothetical protein
MRNQRPPGEVATEEKRLHAAAGPLSSLCGKRMRGNLNQRAKPRRGKSYCSGAAATRTPACPTGPGWGRNRSHPQKLKRKYSGGGAAGVSIN